MKSTLRNGVRFGSHNSSQGTCLSLSSTASKASLDSPPLSRFSNNWGICFSLMGNPSQVNGRDFVKVLPRSDSFQQRRLGTFV